MTPRRTIYTVTVFYAMLLMLNATALHEAVARQPYGPARKFWLSVTEPLAITSRTLQLHRPRQFFYETLGKRINH